MSFCLSSKVCSQASCGTQTVSLMTGHGYGAHSEGWALRVSMSSPAWAPLDIRSWGLSPGSTGTRTRPASVGCLLVVGDAQALVSAHGCPVIFLRSYAQSSGTCSEWHPGSVPSPRVASRGPASGPGCAHRSAINKAPHTHRLPQAVVDDWPTAGDTADTIVA